MEIKNTEESEVLKKLNNMPEQELIKRYIKRHHAHNPTLRAQFLEELNKSDDDNNFVYSAVTILQGANLNHIYSEVFKKYYETLINLGYQFRIDALLSDLTDLFNEDTNATLEASDLPNNLSPYVTAKIKKFSEIIDNKVITPLKNHASKNIDIQ